MLMISFSEGGSGDSRRGIALSMKNTRLFYLTDERLWRTSQIMRGCFGLPRLMLTIVTMRGMSTSTTAIQTTTIRTITIMFGWCVDESGTRLSFDEHFFVWLPVIIHHTFLEINGY
jgi:hypothetical protein